MHILVHHLLKYILHACQCTYIYRCVYEWMCRLKLNSLSVGKTVRALARCSRHSPQGPGPSAELQIQVGQVRWPRTRIAIHNSRTVANAPCCQPRIFNCMETIWPTRVVLLWSMDSPPSLETVHQAVYSLYNNPNSASKEKASLWLGELQKSVSAQSRQNSLKFSKLLPTFPRFSSGLFTIVICTTLLPSSNQEFLSYEKIRSRADITYVDVLQKVVLNVGCFHLPSFYFIRMTKAKMMIIFKSFRIVFRRSNRMFSWICIDFLDTRFPRFAESKGSCGYCSRNWVLRKGCFHRVFM